MPMSFIESTLEEFKCPFKIQTAISVAIEELFVNVAHYAYPDSKGDVTINIKFNEDTREVTFIIKEHYLQTLFALS